MTYKGKKVLIIRFSSIGDIILTTPIIRAVKTQWNAHVTLLTLEKNLNVLKYNSYIDEILSFESNPSFKGYDLIIDLQKNKRSRMLCFKSGVKFITFDKQNVNKWLFTTFKINRLPNKHLVDRYFEAVRQIGLVNDDKGLDYFYNTDLSILSNLPEEYIVLNCGGTYFTKRIPLEKCQQIITSSICKIILLGGNDVDSIGKQLEQDSNVINLTGRTSLDESAAVINKSKHLITSDSALMHIGAALQKEMTVLWGNTTKEFGMYPYYGIKSLVSYQDSKVNINCNPCSKLGYAKCPKGHFKCMLDQDISNLYK